MIMIRPHTSIYYLSLLRSHRYPRAILPYLGPYKGKIRGLLPASSIIWLPGSPLMRRQLLLLYSRTGSTAQNAIIGQPGRRGYHDDSFGFRKPREYVFPDCKRDFVQSFYTNLSSVRSLLLLQTHNRSSKIELQTPPLCDMLTLCAHMVIAQRV